MYTPGLSFIQLFDRFKVFRAGYNFDPMGCTCMCNEKNCNFTEHVFP